MTARLRRALAWFNPADTGGWFGAPFRALPGAAVQSAATPPSGTSEEAIWDQRYDTQLFTSAATVNLNFFQVTNADRTLSNMGQGGTLPSPWSLQIHMITMDILSIIPVTINAAAAVTGVLDDLALLIFSSNARPTWTLTINEKQYGPYSLTLLHGTGGPVGFNDGTQAAGASVQYAYNTTVPGWNYFGRVIILTQNPFNLNMTWAAAPTLTGNKRIRASLFGVLNRKVQ
jgi:hypothetical protein